MKKTPDVYLVPSQTFAMGFFVKIDNDFCQKLVLAKGLITWTVVNMFSNLGLNKPKDECCSWIVNLIVFQKTITSVSIK